MHASENMLWKLNQRTFWAREDVEKRRTTENMYAYETMYETSS
jgi:hypothetical protein